MNRFRFALVSVLLLPLLACGGDGGDDSGDLRTDACSTLGLNSRIINGTECDSTNSPVVALNILTSSGSFICSGTMVTSTAVLTAAHCFPAGEQILATSIDANGTTISGTRVYVHPDYFEGATALFNDVAILELSVPANLPTVPLVLSRAVSLDDEIQIFGYGRTEDGIETVGTLRSGEMRVSDVTADHVIANFDGSDGSNTCQGDSGGPALLTLSDGSVGIVGITSSGSVVDCSAGDVSLFANVQSSSYLSFILSVLPGVPSI